jgi:phosphoribosylanthranilate isomerase
MLQSSRPLVVGVFTSESTPSEINSIALSVGLDLIQLHGNSRSDLDIARYVSRPVIKAFHMGSDDVGDLVTKSAGCVSMCLFDSSGGGSGKTWDWNTGVVDGVPFILAGGLTAENVGEGVKRLRPWGVDVAGGVEGDVKGIKDLGKVDAFIHAVRDLQ